MTGEAGACCPQTDTGTVSCGRCRHPPWSNDLPAPRQQDGETPPEYTSGALNSWRKAVRLWHYTTKPLHSPDGGTDASSASHRPTGHSLQISVPRSGYRQVVSSDGLAATTWKQMNRRRQTTGRNAQPAPEAKPTALRRHYAALPSAGPARCI